MDSKSRDDRHSGSRNCYASFDDWYTEIIGVSLRAEQLTGPVDELRAAFEAGRAAGNTCHKCLSVSSVYLQVCDDCMTRFNQLDA